MAKCGSHGFPLGTPTVDWSDAVTTRVIDHKKNVNISCYRSKSQGFFKSLIQSQSHGGKNPESGIWNRDFLVEDAALLGFSSCEKC